MYYYGHGSWIAIVVFAAVFAIRALTSARRRDRGTGGLPPGRSFMAPPPRAPGRAPAGEAAGSARSAGSGVAPGWFADPTGRHEQRYWSGTEWSEHVVDNGVPGTDLPPAPPHRSSE